MNDGTYKTRLQVWGLLASEGSPAVDICSKCALHHQTCHQFKSSLSKAYFDPIWRSSFVHNVITVPGFAAGIKTFLWPIGLQANKAHEQNRPGSPWGFLCVLTLVTKTVQFALRHLCRPAWFFHAVYVCSCMVILCDDANQVVYPPGATATVISLHDQ